MLFFAVLFSLWCGALLHAAPIDSGGVLFVDSILSFSIAGNITFSAPYVHLPQSAFVDGGIRLMQTTGTNLLIESTTDSSSVGTGAVVASGGASVAGTTYLGTGLVLPSIDATGTVLLNYFESVQVSTTFTGPFSVAQVVDVTYTRIGILLMITYPEVVASCTSSNFISQSPAVPTRFRFSSGEKRFSIDAVDNSADVVNGGAYLLLSAATGAPVIAASLALASFSNTGSCGFRQFNVAWHAA